MNKAPAWIAFGIAILIGCAASIFMSVQTSEYVNVSKDDILKDLHSIEACEAEVFSGASNIQKLDTAYLSSVSQYCFSNTLRRGQVIDLTIDRTVFADQHYDHHILLWLVVFITMSGVFLAGVQIFAAYRLSSLTAIPPDLSGGIDIDKSGKLSVKSSVAGVVILAISFAFFLVFVQQIHLITNLFNDPADKSATDIEKKLMGAKNEARTPAPDARTTTAVNAIQLAPGGLGSPPTSLPNKKAALTTNKAEKNQNRVGTVSGSQLTCGVAAK